MNEKRNARGKRRYCFTLYTIYLLPTTKLHFFVFFYFIGLTATCNKPCEKEDRPQKAKGAGEERYARVG